MDSRVSQSAPGGATASIVREVATELRLELRRELLQLGIGGQPLLPLPCDYDAEQDVLSAIVCGSVLPRELAPLGAEHFASTLFQAVFGAAKSMETRGDCIDPADIARELQSTHLCGVEVSREVVTIAWCTPALSRPRLVERAHHIIDLAQVRHVLKGLARADALCRIGQLDYLGLADAVISTVDGATKRPSRSSIYWRPKRPYQRRYPAPKGRQRSVTRDRSD